MEGPVAFSITMIYNIDMIIFSLIVIVFALGFGYLVSLSFVEKPTLGDVVFYTVKAYSVKVALIIGFVWWASSY